ncbi:fatty-acyl-CoA synthase [Mobiluncus mulieris]|uniref:Short-chain-fatty-acid--CoA ligase n=1 Tax=Mobiluncus mulieris TaxID=2052 RepID=A0A8G2HSG4_9ACTO|nr:class I adenylate-forming enzyme family protein [Mobiluncus mulieris]MBB5845799.1 fatty-acyl-CoA synthase [Mobiluncus mulieris]MCU9996793.1 acyl--CoA ligase [Mobiluncus mulieris]STO15541.1 Short-chain-fatty-acid--CoA ligase [Mobiluncus mulieris]
MTFETIDYSPLRLLQEAALRHPSRRSLIWVRQDGTNLEKCETWNVAQSFARVVALARLLRDWGVQPGARLAVIGKNSPWHLVTFAAAAALPAVTVPLNWQYPEAELAGVLAHCEPEVIFVDTDNHAKVAAALSASGVEPRKVVEFGELARWCAPSVTFPGTTSMAARVSADSSPTSGSPGSPSALDLALCMRRQLGSLPICTDTTPGAIIYTSGTAASPKAALLTYKNLWWGCQNFREVFEYSPDCVEAVAAPLSHIGGFNGTTTDLFTNGGTVVVFEKFDPELVLRAIERFQIQMMFGVPTMFRLLADAAETGNYDTSSFTRALVGGAAWDTELAARVIALGWGPINIWGMTEQSASGACLTSEVMTGREVGVGRAFPHIELRVTGKDGRPVPPGAIGQLECRGPSVTGQYFRDPELSAAMIDPETGWLKTGDLGVFDQDGFLRLRGRLSDTINTGGEKVFALKVAEALAALPTVAEAAVVGVPDTKWGEAVGAVVVARHPENPPALAEIREATRIRLAPYELPQRLAIVPTIPLNSNGKPDRELLLACFH